MNCPECGLTGGHKESCNTPEIRSLCVECKAFYANEQYFPCCSFRCGQFFRVKRRNGLA